MNRKSWFYIIPMLLAITFVCLAQDAPKDKDNRGIDVVGKKGALTAERGDFWLVVIGINEYINVPKLQTAVNDAKEVKKVLIERYGFDPKRLVELYDADATAKRIYAELRSLSGKIKPDDSLFIYYAGHGSIDEITKSGAWIPVDGVKDDPTTWLENDSIKKYLTVDAIKARHILLISDSCFAGDFFARSIQAPNITDAYVRTAFGKSSREAITSGGVEPVADKGFENHSVFAHFLLKSLKENTEPYLLPAAVHERIKGGVSMNARQQTQYGSLTGTGTELGGSFVLFLKGATGNLDEMVKEKNERISMLKQAEDEMKARNDAENAETKAREQKIADLDKQIAELQKKVGVSGKGDASTFDQIVAIVEQKEQQAKELAEMRRKAENERKQREAEIARLKAKEQEKQCAALQADITKYEKVAQSEFGKDLKDSAWNALLGKWGLQKGSVPTGNISALYVILKLQAPRPAGFVEDFVLIPTLAGSYKTGGIAKSVYVSDSYAYVADSDSGLQIIDISNPASPTLAGSYKTEGVAYDVYVSGSYAYMASAGFGLQIIDISNPAAPALVGSYRNVAFGVYVAGSYAYVSDNSSGLQIINISNPAAPVLVGSYKARVKTGGIASNVYVSGVYAYVVDVDSGLQIINISNPVSPTLAGSYKIEDVAYDVCVSGSYAYVAYDESGLQIINCSNPAAPTLAGEYKTPSYAFGVYVSGSYAYVAANSSGLQIINISNPVAPALVGECKTPGWAVGVYVIDDYYAYVADGKSGLQIIRIDVGR